MALAICVEGRVVRMLERTNVLGAVVAVSFYVSAILVFAFRLMGKTQYGFWLGIFEFCLAVPIVYLLFTAPSLRRPVLYYIQLGLMLLWLAAELWIDYIAKISFRANPAMRGLLISYVTLFFAGSGGMIGVAANAGRAWSIPASILFLIMAVLAFVQRAVTGM